MNRKMLAWAGVEPWSLGYFLVADDNELVLGWLCRTLRRYRPCLPARSLPEAYQHVDAGHRIVGAILDVRFPGSATGIDLLAHMRHQRGYRCPALIISGHIRTSDIADAYDLGARALHVDDAAPRLDQFARECLVRSQVGHEAIARAVDVIVARYSLGEFETEILAAALQERRADWFRVEQNMPEGTYRSRVRKLLKLTTADNLDVLVREVLLEALEESADAPTTWRACV